MSIEISRLMQVNPDYKGLRLNIPRRIVAELQLKARDIVEWEVSSRNGRKVASISKMTSTSSQVKFSKEKKDMR